MILGRSARGWWSLSGDGWTLRIGDISDDDAGMLGDLLAAFERSRRGGFGAALLALAKIRAQRGERPGAASIRLYEGEGDPALRAGDWHESADIGPATRRRSG